MLFSHAQAGKKNVTEKRVVSWNRRRLSTLCTQKRMNRVGIYQANWLVKPRDGTGNVSCASVCVRAKKRTRI